MKIAITLICLFVTIFTGQAQENEKYVRKMQETLHIMDTARTSAGMIYGANQFERIANAEKDQWLPYYYAAFAYSVISYMEKDNATKDEYLDKADALIASAEAVKENESEIYVVKAMINQGRIQVDPMSRGQKYGGMAMQQLQQAMKLNPENPRAYYIMGTNLYYMPPAYGGGADKAKEMLIIAMEKYEIENEDPLWPKWGKERAEQMLKGIEKAQNNSEESDED